MNICHWGLKRSWSRNGPSNVTQFAPPLLVLLIVNGSIFDELCFPQGAFLIIRHLVYFTSSSCSKVSQVATALLNPNKNSAQQMTLAGSGPHLLWLHGKKAQSHAKEQQALGTLGQTCRLCYLDLDLLNRSNLLKAGKLMHRSYSAERESNLFSH